MDNAVELGLSLLSSSICERLLFVVDLQITHLKAEKVMAVLSWVKKIWKFFMTFVISRLTPPPPHNGTFSIHFYPIFSFCNLAYIKRTLHFPYNWFKTNFLSYLFLGLKLQSCKMTNIRHGSDTFT